MGIDPPFFHRCAGTEQGERRQVGHAAERGCLLQGLQQLANRKVVVSLGPIGGLEPAGREGIEEDLVMQGGSLRAVGKAVLQHQVLPFLQDRGCRVPVKGVHKDHNLVLQQALLLAVDVDLEIRVLGIQIDERYTVDPGRSPRQRTIRLGALQRRVREKDENFSLLQGLSPGILRCSHRQHFALHQASTEIVSSTARIFFGAIRFLLYASTNAPRIVSRPKPSPRGVLLDIDFDSNWSGRSLLRFGGCWCPQAPYAEEGNPNGRRAANIGRP